MWTASCFAAIAIAAVAALVPISTTTTTASFQHGLLRAVKEDAAGLAGALFDVKLFEHEMSLLFRKGDAQTLWISLQRDVAVLRALVLDAERTLCAVPSPVAFLPFGVAMSLSLALPAFVRLFTATGEGGQGSAWPEVEDSGTRRSFDNDHDIARMTVGELGAVGESLGELAGLMREMQRLTQGGDEGEGGSK